MKTIKVRPADGRRVRNPARNYEPFGDDFETVNPSDPYIARRLEAGDLVEATKPPVRKQAEPPKTTTKQEPDKEG